MIRRYAINLEREDRFQYLIAILCVIIYAGCLFFPLADKDAAHHANIALHMLQFNDYYSLVDRYTPYLDKPHFLFWISAASFKLFGVTTFAHRLPAVLFGLISIYSTYQLTRHLFNKTTAKIAALTLATAQGFIISIIDARMETPLMAAIIFGLWQWIVFIDTNKLKHIIFASLGVAVAFSTKGWIGPAITLFSVALYIVLNKRWLVFLNWKTWLFIPLLALFISPVLYAYYLQFNLHPELVVRGRDHINGIKFILWDQNFERFKGDSFVKGGRNSSVFFLYHTFLWAFFPWCIAAYIAVVFWIRRMIWKRKWHHPANFAAATFAIILFTISFSRFKMPHYIFMLMPLATIFTAPFLRFALSGRFWLNIFYPMQVVFACLVIVATIVINYYFFMPDNALVHIIGPVLMIALIVLLIKKNFSKPVKTIYISAVLIIVFSFYVMYNFFPQLMKYQGGNELVSKMKEEKIVIKDENILLIDENAHTFDFYRGYNHTIVKTTALVSQVPQLNDKYFLLTASVARSLPTDSLRIEPVISHVDYNVTTLKLKFLNPKTRATKLDTLMLAKIYPK